MTLTLISLPRSDCLAWTSRLSLPRTGSSTPGLRYTGDPEPLSPPTSHAVFSYGFGAPFLLGGPLEDSDPGCGTEQLYDVLARYPDLQHLPDTLYAGLQSSAGAEDPYKLVAARHLPAVKMFDLKVQTEKDNDPRSGRKSEIDCLLTVECLDNMNEVLIFKIHYDRCNYYDSTTSDRID